MQNNQPKLTVSGYRGVWGKDLTPQIAYEFTSAFAKIIKGQNGKKVLIGMDARKSGPEIFLAVKTAFQKEGLQVDNAGIIPTPSVLLLIRKMGYDGGLVITASHNPKEYNGLKFVLKTGLFAGPEIIEKININKENSTDLYISSGEKYDVENNKEFRKLHIDEILKNIPVSLIKNKRFKVSLDTINSAGSIIVPEFLKELGCEINLINGDQSGEFAHEPEPLVKNLEQLSEAVKKNGSDIGFAVDPDTDRLVLIDEKGKILSEEYTLALAIKNVLQKEPSDIAVNMSTSRMSEDIAENFGKKVIRTKVGELNVVNKMFEINSSISGEGNGGVIYPKINATRDSMVGMALVLELLAKENKVMSQIIEEIPKYIMGKEKYFFNGDLGLLYKKMKEKFSDALFVNELDGIRFDWKDSWIHVRPSNTEPKTWIIAEAKDEKIIEKLFEEAVLGTDICHFES